MKLSYFRDDEMKEIRIKTMALENFKSHSFLRLDFNGRNASIYGDNATGKTSIYDALMWVLFSKDSQGNGEKSIEIKPLNSMGEVKDHLAVTSVEVTLIVDGEEITLKRTYKEVWSTKRGSNEPTYDGNTSDYYLDGIPCKRNLFQEKVNEIVSEDTFRMLTSVSYFAKDLPWQERRAVLFEVSGVMEDGEILKTDERFLPLIESIGKHSLEDYKKKLLSEKKGLVGAKTEIPARISECQKTIRDIEAIDFIKAKAEVQKLQIKADSISGRILEIENDNAAQKKRLEIREAELELSALENENKAHREKQLSSNVNTDLFTKDLLRAEMGLNMKNKTLTQAEKQLEFYEKEIAASRDRWITVNGEAFTGGECPTCGQALPAKQAEAAKEAFEAQKGKRLREIEQTASVQKEAKKRLEDQIDDLQKEILQLEGNISALKTEIELVESARIEPTDLKDYSVRAEEITGRIRALRGELADIEQNSFSVKESLRREKEAIQKEIDAQTAIISKEALLDYTKGRITELREDAKNTAAALDAIEMMLFLMDEYSRYKTQFVEDSINDLFRVARFRLFREQANGGIEDRCDVIYDGVPYVSVNNGMKINLGIDIINTISRAYGVRVPLFIDNAESVTKLEQSAGQVIRLVVSEQDKELRVNYED